MMRTLTRHASLAVLLLAAACGGDDTNATTNSTPAADLGQQDMGADAGRCPKNERFDSTLGTCIPDFSLEDMFMGSQDMGADMAAEADMAASTDMPDGTCVNTILYVDKDGDDEGVDDPKTNITECVKPGEKVQGYATVAGDCDDTDVRRGAAAIELCDEVDNNCDNQNNEGLECAFFAHSQKSLYLIDPFKRTAEKKATWSEKQPLLDIDTDPKTGLLYGVTRENLYKYDFGWQAVGKFAQDIGGANGLAIDRSSKAYVTKDDKIFEIDLADGSIVRQTTVQQYTVDNQPRTVQSSGDCVINKGDTFFVTSRNSSDSAAPDALVFVDISNGTTSLVGETSHRAIYGLTAAWGKMYGLTSEGEVLSIDENSGKSALIFTVQGERWYGAASTPKR